MLLNDASDIRIGTRKVLKVYVRGTQVWPRGETDKYLYVSPAETQWMLPGNGWTINYNVESNTDVKVGIGN